MTAQGRVLLLLENVGVEYVARIQSGASRAARTLGIDLWAENIYGTGRQAAELVQDASLAGVVLAPPSSDDRHLLSVIEARRLPYARLAPLLDLDRGSTVGMDEYDAARAITHHLIEKGHRRIGFVRGPRSHLVSIRRFNGYANAIGGLGLRVDPALVVQGDFSRQSGREQALTLFKARPTAIFASNDEMAVGVIEAANRAGIAVPGEISVVGFDDNAVAKTVRPRLTSVRQPVEEMAATACRIVAERIRNPGKPSAHEKIVERDSVAIFSDPESASLTQAGAAT
jgi:LacI family transcriptional regulator